MGPHDQKTWYLVSSTFNWGNYGCDLLESFRTQMFPWTSIPISIFQRIFPVPHIATRYSLQWQDPNFPISCTYLVAKQIIHGLIYVNARLRCNPHLLAISHTWDVMKSDLRQSASLMKIVRKYRQIGDNLKCGFQCPLFCTAEAFYLQTFPLSKWD